MPETTTIKNLTELTSYMKQLLDYLENNDFQVIALSGDLGAGKTTSVQELAKELGISEVVTSPTFTIMKQYQIIKESKFRQLVHIDAYRIETLEELRPLGFLRLLEDTTNLFCIEWAERIEAVLPKNTIYLNFKTIDENTREVVFKA